MNIIPQVVSEHLQHDTQVLGLQQGLGPQAFLGADSLEGWCMLSIQIISCEVVKWVVKKIDQGKCQLRYCLAHVVRAEP